MSTDVLTIGPDAPLKEAARRMIEAGVSGLPVTDGSGKPIGIITEADFVASEAGRRPEHRAGLLRFFVKDEEMPKRRQVVSDVMTKEVKVLKPDLDHAEAARLMQKAGIKRVPIVDDDGRLIGLISRADMLRAYVRPDQEIIDEIAGHVMRDVLWIDPVKVTVGCIDGNITLSGHLETRSDALLLAELAGRLDGVVSVADNLTWEVDNTKLEMTSPPMGYPRHNW